MDILIIGYSSLARRKVIPALLKLDEVEKIHIASRSRVPGEAIPEKSRGEFFSGYDTALRQLKPCLAYISLPNSLHGEWAHQAIERGFHAAIDKPSVMKVEDAFALYELSRSRGVSVAEVNVWNYHPMATQLSAIVSEDDPPLFAQLTFTSPPLNPENFRYAREMGGGILWDRGSYAISCGRVFLDGTMPDEISVRVNSRDENGLDLSVSLQMQYGPTALQAAFSLEGEYTNELVLLGKNYVARAHRIFTPPPEVGGELQLRKQNSSETIHTESCDTFSAFFKDLIQKIESGHGSTFGEILLSDARVFEQIIDAQGDIDAD